MAHAPARLTGLDLKLARTARRLRIIQVAAALGVPRQRITELEARERVHSAVVERYFDALARAEADG